MKCFKQAFSDKLQARTLHNQQDEFRVKSYTLNKIDSLILHLFLKLYNLTQQNSFIPIFIWLIIFVFYSYNNTSRT